jgi:acyl-CoA thioesterase-2
MLQPSADSALAALIARLDLKPLTATRFRAEAEGSARPRVFGGLIVGQAAVAAARTVTGMAMHSLHAYFLQPGDPAAAVEYEVLHLKDGKNFHARQVLGRQGERIIVSMQASFAREQPGFEHADPMPEAPAPEQVEPLTLGYWGADAPVQLRDCDRGSLAESARNDRRRLWLRPAHALPDEPELHLGLLVFASDMTLMRTGLLPHPQLHQPPRIGASLDHALWFHRPPRFDDWLLATMRSPAAHSGRPLILGAMYRRDGTRVMSVAQEGLIRPQA